MLQVQSVLDQYGTYRCFLSSFRVWGMSDFMSSMHNFYNIQILLTHHPRIAIIAPCGPWLLGQIALYFHQAESWPSWPTLSGKHNDYSPMWHTQPLSGPRYCDAVIVTGGSPGYNKAELIWPDGGPLCSLPDLADDREDHTQSGLVACGTGGWHRDWSLKVSPVWSRYSGWWRGLHLCPPG